MPLPHAERIRLFASADIYAVITSDFCAGRSPLAIVEALVAAGVRVVQMREKTGSDRELLGLAGRYRRLCPGGKVLFIVNDRIDIALASGADGVHLGQDDLPPRQARALSADLLVGVSTHGPEEIRSAIADGASYVNIGPVFPTRTKEHAGPAAGVENVRAWSAGLPVPFSVMGGINAENIGSLKAAGASIFAMVTELTRAPDISARVAALRRAAGGPR